MQDKITTLSYAGSTAAVTFGSLELNQLIAIAGLAVGIATFFINWLYQHRKHELDKEIASRIIKNQIAESDNEQTD